MTKEEIKNELTTYLTAIENKTAEINVMLVDQNNQRKKRYKGLMLKTKLDDIKDVLESSISYLLEELDKRSLDAYDLELSIDDSLQAVEASAVINSNEIINEISVVYTNENVVTENTDLTTIKFIVIQIFTNENSLYLFKKYVQPSTSYKTSQKFILSGGMLKPFTDKIITLNSVIDAILLNKTYYVLNRNNFNTIFVYKDVFARILDENVDKIGNSGLLTDSNQFIEDCKSDGRYLARLTKVILAKGFEEVGKKKEEIPKVIQGFNLSLVVSEKGEIVYRGKEDIPEMLNLLLRHYVIDALTSNRMIAAAIQEYSAGVKEENKG